MCLKTDFEGINEEDDLMMNGKPMANNGERLVTGGF